MKIRFCVARDSLEKLLSPVPQGPSGMPSQECPTTSKAETDDDEEDEESDEEEEEDATDSEDKEDLEQLQEGQGDEEENEESTGMGEEHPPWVLVLWAVS